MSTTVQQSGGTSSSSTGKRIRAQGVRLKYLLMKSAVSAGLLVGVWLVGYYRFSVSWVIVPSLVCVGVVEYRKSRKLAAGARDSEQSLLGGVDELPTWVSILGGVGLKSDGTDGGTLSRPRIRKPLYGLSQGDETGD